jgi:general secretion pathway protein K
LGAARTTLGIAVISGASNSERGVALLGAVLLAAIVTVLAVAWLDRLDVFVGRASGVLEELQAADHVASMEAWAVVVLRRDGAGATVDHRNEVWARPSTTLSVPGGQARGSLSDLQGRFNLNALVIGGEPNAAAIVFFKALLRRLDLSNVRVEAIIDWLDPDTIALPGGGEDVLYLRAEPPYRTANGPMASVQELRFVADIDGRTLARLMPYVVALPEPGAINVNTAPPLILDVLAGGRGGEELARRALAKPFASLQDWLAAAPGTPADFSTLVTTTSDYFQLDTITTVGRRTWHYETRLRRNGKDVSVQARQRRIETNEGLADSSARG